MPLVAGRQYHGRMEAILGQEAIPTSGQRYAVEPVTTPAWSPFMGLSGAILTLRWSVVGT